MGALAEELVTKVCSTCRTEKPITEYYRNRRRRDGRQTVCGACQRARERRVTADQVARELAGLEMEPEDLDLLGDDPEMAPHVHRPWQVDLRRQVWMCADPDCGERVALLEGWPADPAWAALEEAVSMRNLPLGQAAVASGYEVMTGWLLFWRGQKAGSFVAQAEAWERLQELRRLARAWAALHG